MKITNISKNLFESAKKILDNNYKFFLWLLIILTVDYLGLFMVETILPGFVMNFFNLNLLLFAVLAGWLLLSFFTEEESRVRLGNKIATILLVVFLGLFALGLIFSLYKANSWQLVVYFVLAVIAAKLIFDHWREKNN
ncbi:MAG: hypothetical protein R6V40_00125 [Candidatus Moraniibacteriota bacterium]